jgi:hypothetical protein
MEAPQELVFWRHVRRAAAVARHGMALGARAGSYNITCVPGGGDAADVGWRTHSGDGDGVTINAAVLATPAAFDEWLQGVLAWGTLVAGADEVMMRRNVRRVGREPSLAPPYFVAFLERYVDCGAARAVVEASKVRLVVGAALDVVGGELHVPWFIDPASLLAVLASGAGGGRIAP